MNEINQTELFKKEVEKNVELQGSDKELKVKTVEYLKKLDRHKYGYNFTWLGQPIIQMPQDIYAIQELIWKVQPDLIIETGIAHGGSLIMSASMLALLDYCDGYDNFMTHRKVIGIDIDIRPHNREAINRHPLSNFIHMIEGSSIDDNVIKQVKEMSEHYDKIMVFLDSNHTHNHVLQELINYAPLVSVGSYCIAFDTLIEDISNSNIKDKPWGHGNSPKTAVHEFLRTRNEFIIDKRIENKLVLTSSPDGYLLRIK